MLRRKLSLLFTSVLLAGALLYAIVRLIGLRENVGDVYPPNSTLRADPLGSKALFEALDRMSGVQVSRNYRPLVRMQPEAPVALVYLGLGSSAMWEPGEREHFESLVGSGSRAIMAFSSQAAVTAEAKKTEPTANEEKQKQKPESEKAGEKKSGAKEAGQEKKGSETKKGDEKKSEGVEKKNKKKGDKEEDEEVANTPFEEVARHWGFRFEIAKTGKGKLPADSARVVSEGGNLEPVLPWQSALSFADLQPHWKVLYRAGDAPVVIERSWGKGSIVLIADSFFLSNEALQTPTRASKFVAWMVGPLRSVIFDEEHLGLSESSGVITLARKYRLEGLAAGLALLVALFFWQNLVRFIPPVEEEMAQAGILPGRGSSEAFVALLRRSVPRSQLLSVCVREWRRAFAAEGRMLHRLAGYVVPAEGVINAESQILAEYRRVTGLTATPVSPSPDSPGLPQT